MSKVVKYMKGLCICNVCLLLCVLMGCSGQRPIRQFKNEDRIKIVTTIYPLQNFASEIGGEQVEIINLVPAGMEPHDFELSTADMQLLEEADVFIYNGAGMEHFVDKTLAAVTNKDLVVVEAAKDIKLLEAKHSHDEDTHESDEETYDPHTWLSIENAVMEAEAIKEALCMIDTNHADDYEKNYTTYKERLDALDETYREELAKVSSKTIVVAHEAFGYLCQEYGLSQVAVEGLSADSEPDTARMKEIIDFCRENKIKVIFFEELVSPKVANMIAQEVGAETDLLNPIEGITAEQESQSLDYIGLMEQNLEALKRALK
ncbi:MAG: metal ABC transporter substrate-binding protein [Eubacteriales bacterium]|nr:metal ABC transporter substrate-binding protein [Eubacteriales bacterium]